MKKYIFLILFLLSGCGDGNIGTSAPILSDPAPSEPSPSEPNQDEGEVLEVYTDWATLPSFQHITHIVSEQSENKKIIYWNRFNSIIKDADLDSINAESHSAPAAVPTRVAEYLSTNNVSKMIIHGNAYASHYVIDILKEVYKINSDVEIELELYDDGSVEYIKLYEFSKLPESEQSHRISLTKDNIENSINGTEDYLREIQNMYGFAQLYPTTYHMLRKDIFDTDFNLESIKGLMFDHAEQMQWDQYASFNDEQKALFHSLIDFDPAELRAQFDESNKDNFIYIGTNHMSATAQQQIDIIQHGLELDPSIDESSIVDYDLFFKGHPSATYNQEIIDAHNMTEIFNKIPFEALMMTGTLPEAVGGMASSVFFSLPPTVENKFVYYKFGTDLENDALTQVMLALGIVSEDKIHVLDEFIEPEPDPAPVL